MGYSRLNEEWLEKCEAAEREVVARVEKTASGLGISVQDYCDSFEQSSFWEGIGYMWKRMGAYHKLQFATISALQISFIVGFIWFMSLSAQLQ